MAELEHDLDPANGPGTHHEFIFQCNGYDAHYVRITRDDVDSDWNLFWVESMFRSRRLRDKVRETWRVWRGENVYDEVVVTEETAARMREALL